MAELSLTLDNAAFLREADAIIERLERLAALIQGRDPDDPCRMFVLPVNDVLSAMTANGLMVVAGVPSGTSLALSPHPALVAYGALVEAICAGLEERLEAAAASGAEA